jgi:hypothetical protein
VAHYKKKKKERKRVALWAKWGWLGARGWGKVGFGYLECYGRWFGHPQKPKPSNNLNFFIFFRGYNTTFYLKEN